MLFLKKGFTTKEEVIKYLQDNYTVSQLIDELADRITNDRTVNKITVSQEEFDYIVNLFRVRGVKENGEIETRGRKPKTEE